MFDSEAIKVSITNTLSTMKLTLLLLLFVQFAHAQRTTSETYTYAPGVTFTVVNISHEKTAEYGNNRNRTLYVAPKGQHFKGAWLEFKNETSEDVIIDFEQFFLVDSNGTKHHIESVIQSMKFTNTVEKYKQKLKAGKNKTIMMGFWPAFNKTDKVTQMIADGQEVNFTYK